MKARMDIHLLCHQNNMELVYDELLVAKSKASFFLDKNTQLLVYQWLKSLYFPYGYALNISKLVNLKDDKLYEIKSYNCHVFIKHSFHLLIGIYCQKRCRMHS